MTVLTILELAIAAMACVPIVRLLVNRSTRQVAPRVHAALWWMVVVFAGGMSYLGIRHPEWLHAPALATAALVAATWWRARVDYGASRQLPPGSMSLTRSIEAIVDRRFYRDRFERHGPIFKMTQFHHRTICVLGLELGHQLLRERIDLLGPTALAFNRDLEGGFLRYMDATTHEKYGGLFRTAFSRAVVAAASPRVATTLRAELESRLEWRAPTAMTPDAFGALSRHLAFLAMLRLVFDFESGTPRFERYREAHAIFARQAPDRPLTEATITALKQLRQVVTEQADHFRQRARAGISASSCALEEILRLDPDQPDMTTLDNLIFVTRIASGNVGSYLVWQLVMLGRHPLWIARLRSELSSGVTPGTPNLTRRIIMETLRLEQSEFLYRTVLEDFTEGGYLFPKGWLLRLCVRESHRRSDIFENPDVFDPDRFARRKFSSSEYSPFGFHRHACLGVPTTHMIGAWVIESLVRTRDWTVREEDPPTRSFRHWKHWQPSPRTVLEFRPAADGPTS